MNSEKLIHALERFATVLPAVVNGIDGDDARWKPPDGGWSILEIVMHLADEEASDFRPRLERTLAEPQQEWDPIDPEGWAISRRYNEGRLDEAVQRFVQARQESMARLRGLGKQLEWSRAHEHPRLGTLRAGDLLTSWTAHDILHLRQISKRLYQLIERDAEGFSIAYAGSWTA